MSRPCQRLLVLTLALEDAVQNDSWSEAEVLLRERGELLDQLARAPIHPSERSALERCQQAEARVLQLLLSSKESVGETIRRRMEGKRAAAAYSPRSQQALSIDRAD